jgi:hypothetical protein
MGGSSTSSARGAPCGPDRGEERWIAIEDVARYREGRRRRAAGRRPGCVPRPGDGGARRPARPIRADPRPVPDAGSRPTLGPAGRRRRRAPSSGCWRTARSCAASSGPVGAEREWLDPEVPPVLRRRSARPACRREVEPVEPAALGGSCRPGMASPAFGEAGAGAPTVRGPRAPRRGRRPARPACRSGFGLERDVLPARIPATSRRLLDELGAMGEVAWVGRGSLGRDDGRIALVRPVGRPPGRSAPRRGPTDPAGPRHEAIREHLRAAGRLVLPGDLRCRRRLAPIATCSTRSGTWSGRARSRTTRSPRSGLCAGSDPPATCGAGQVA